MADYFYVHKKILPNYLEKVLEAREMLDSREAATVTEATERIGISRNTYYRYKDYVFRAKDPTRGQQAVLSLLLADLPGALSAVLSGSASSPFGPASPRACRVRRFFPCLKQ
jgi:chorismate mutase